MTCSLREKILQYDRAVPRYTSYPVAPHFQDVDSDTPYQEWLRAIPEGETLSLYIHIPYCKELCWYCGCNTKITKKYAPVEKYLNLIRREIIMLSELCKDTHKVTHIHFGGGSPSIVTPDDFASLMELISRSFHIDENAEIAMEIDPRGLNDARIDVYAKHGVNRVSLGIQDFDKTVQQAINRPQSVALVQLVMDKLQAGGIHNINFDLIYGLPHQNLQTAKDTFDRVIEFNPKRIAYFGYAHVPWMKKHMRLIDEGALPDTELRFDLFQYGAERLEQAGYHAIGIDHFARPDDELFFALQEKRLRRNFQGYTSDKADHLIGIGVSSIGYVQDHHVQNTPDMPVYNKAIMGGALAVRKYCASSQDDMLRRAVIEQLMCYFTVDLPAICAQYGVEPTYFDAECQALLPYMKQGFVDMDDQNILTIKPEAKAIARIICSVFDAYLAPIEGQKRHSKAI